MNDSNIELITCPECNGLGITDCCDGHMCPGNRKCGRCNGKCAILSDKDREMKKYIEKLMEYR